MIHSDLEDENFFVYEGQITAFDFDECQYHWFVYDIACILRQASWVIPSIEMNNRYTRDEFYRYFMTGYLQENSLDHFWIEQIPYFLRLRELCIYVYLHGKRDLSTFSKDERAFIDLMRHRIENDLPCIELDYKLL
jgi:Ser/Thr protein kinase RdoA (MazF antagonist)